MASNQQRRQERELEELRKQGLAMPERDESGNLINPHIPAYLSKTPWYYGTDGKATLKHQRQDYHQQFSDVQGGINAVRTTENEGKVAIKNTQFRPGACTNCGGMGHNRSSCLERPRAATAKSANTTYANVDRILKDNKVNFESKRDQFANFTENDWIESQRQQKIDLEAQLEKLAEIEKIEDQSKQQQEASTAISLFEKRQELIKQHYSQYEEAKQIYQEQQQQQLDKDAHSTNLNNNDNKEANNTTMTTTPTTTLINQPPIQPKWHYLIDDEWDTDDEIESIYAYTTAKLGNQEDENEEKKNKRANISSVMSLSLQDRIKLNPKMAQTAKQLLINPSTSHSNDSKKKALLGLGLDANGTGVPSTRLIGDVPKYLLNLDDESAFYDPKTHSMRENPFPRDDPRWLDYENRYNNNGGGLDQIKELELFAYEFKEFTGKEINPVLNPTLVSQLKRQYDELKAQAQLNREMLLNKLYGEIFEGDTNSNQNNKITTNNTNSNKPTQRVNTTITTTVLDNNDDEGNDDINQPNKKQRVGGDPTNDPFAFLNHVIDPCTTTTNQFNIPTELNEHDQYSLLDPNNHHNDQGNENNNDNDTNLDDFLIISTKPKIKQHMIKQAVVGLGAGSGIIINDTNNDSGGDTKSTNANPLVEKE